MNWIRHNKLVFILAIVVVAIGVWYGLSSGNEPPPLLTTTTPSGQNVQEKNADQEIIGTLLALRAVTLSGTIFNDASFMSLQDFGTMIVPEPIGRENPFAPLNTPTVRAPGATSTQSLAPAR
jgi:hypothetical protein